MDPSLLIKKCPHPMTEFSGSAQDIWLIKLKNNVENGFKPWTVVIRCYRQTPFLHDEAQLCF